MQFYVIAPLIIFLISCSKSIPILVYIVVWILLVAYGLLNNSFDTRNLLGGGVHFMVGILMAYYRGHMLTLLMQYKGRLFAPLGLVTLFCILIFNHFKSIHPLSILLANLICFGLISIHLYTEKLKIDRGAIVNILLILGVLSYGIYAWHGFLSSFNLLLDNIALHTLSCIVLAYTTYVLVEKPILIFKHKL